MEKLKPCPFCGGNPQYKTYDEPDHVLDTGEFIECSKCHASTSVMIPEMDDVRELVIEKWNTRQP